MLLALAALTISNLQQVPLDSEPKPQPPRFQLRTPILSLPGIMMDARQEGYGIANQYARAKGLQGRVLWVDCTANIDRYNTEEKIVALMQQVKDAGFNTVAYDVKPISGQVVYPSQFAPKIKEWRGRILPEDFDPVPIFSREAKKHGLSLFLTLNAFSEGHRMFKVGPGYENVGWQTVLYEPNLIAYVAGEKMTLGTEPNKVSTQELSLYTDSAKIPTGASDQFAISIDADGRIVDGFEGAGLAPGRLTVPRGGAILVASSAASGKLRFHALPGLHVKLNTEPLLVPIQDRPEQQYPLITNPANPAVIERNIAMLLELALSYDFDGFLYDDRLRYGGLNADFSPQFRSLFEKWLGHPVQIWPEDVYKIQYSLNLQRGIEPGPQYENWLIFRAKVMRDYVRLVRQKINSVRPSLQFGIYAGSWYGEYPTYGANYASHDLDAGFWFMSDAYRQTGFARDLDLLITGAYYKVPTIFDALKAGSSIGATVESAGYLTNRVVNDQTWSYAGIMLSDYKGNPSGLKDALQAATGSTQGVMVFDLSHEIDPFWPVFKQAFMRPAQAPHSDRDHLAELRRRADLAVKQGKKPPTVVIANGTPGAGH